MPPPEMIVGMFLKAVLPAAATAAILFLAIARFGGKDAVSAAAALAMAVGGGLGFWLCDTVELVSGASKWNQLPWAALAALGIGISVRWPGVPKVVAWLTRPACAGVIAWLVIPPETTAEGWWLVPGFVLVDGREIPGLGVPQSAYPKGDAFVLSIAAASIVAKVFRDAIMRRLEEAHPGYGFGKHMGYATAFHLRAIESQGPSPVHRRSFSPIASDAQLPLEGLSR